MEKKSARPLLYGRQPVLAALRGRRKVQKLYLLAEGRGDALDTLRQNARVKGIPVAETDRRSLDSIAGSPDHQGVVAFTEAYPYVSLEDLLEQAQDPPFLLILDHLEDPQNLGSILRTAEAAGVDGVVIPDRRAASLTPAAFKAAAGAAESLAVVREVNLSRVLTRLKDQGFWIVGGEAGGDRIFTDPGLPYHLPLALVIGSEGKGIRRLLQEQCDFLVHIPIRGETSSLNASVAAALLIYAVLQRRLEVSRD